MCTPKSARQKSTLLMAAGLLTALAGCGGGGGGGGGDTPPPPASSTPVARFAYVANTGDNTVSVYLADNTTGQLRHRGYALAGAGPIDVITHPSGEFAYSVNYTDQTISLFTIDWTTGDLASAACDGSANDCSAGGTPTSLVIDSNGLRAYVSNETANAIHVFNVNQATGSLGTFIQTIASGGMGPSTLFLHPSGQYLYAANQTSNTISLFNIDPTNGTLTDTGTVVTSSGTTVTDILLTSDGLHAYIANQASPTIESFDIDASGTMTNTGTVASGGAVLSLAIDPTDSWLYAVNADASGSISAFAIQSDGSLSATNCTTSLNCSVGGTPEGIAIDPTGQFLAVTNRDDNTIDRFTINQSDGSLTSQRTLTTRDMPRGITYLEDTSAVSITPRFAYVAHEASNDITGFTINNSSGALSPFNTFASGKTPTSITTDPTGRFIYVTSSGDDAISAYTINASTGALSLIGGTPTAILQSDPVAIAIDPSGRFLYIANTGSDSISIYEITTSSGALSSVGSPVVISAGSNPTSLAIDPTGRYLYVTNSNAIFDDIWSYEINPADGTLTLNQASVSGTDMDAPVDIAIDPSGRFLYTANNRLINGKCWVSGFALDPNNGNLSELTNSPFSTETATSFNCNPTSISADPLGEYIYSAGTTDRILVYSMNPSNGDLSLSSNALASNDPYSLAIDESGGYLYSANFLGQDVSAFVISASNGSLSQIGTATTTGGYGPISITTVSSFQ
jgi:6-phosphogluconolactonase (cycloisomerase 2 family)